MNGVGYITPHQLNALADLAGEAETRGDESIEFIHFGDHRSEGHEVQRHEWLVRIKHRSLDWKTIWWTYHLIEHDGTSYPFDASVGARYFPKGMI